MFDCNKGTVSLQCRQEYQMSLKLLSAVTSPTEILLNGKIFSTRSPLGKIILQCSIQKNIDDSQFRKLHNNAAVMNGNVHDVIAHAQWFVSISNKTLI